MCIKKNKNSSKYRFLYQDSIFYLRGLKLVILILLSNSWCRCYINFTYVAYSFYNDLAVKKVAYPFRCNSSKLLAFHSEPR